MTHVGLSEGAAAVDPALASWLAGVGLAAMRIDAAAAAPKDMIRIIAASERSSARHSDIILDIRDGAPAYTAGAKGFPAEIGFGFEDMAFGHALIAELVRPNGRPA